MTEVLTVRSGDGRILRHGTRKGSSAFGDLMNDTETPAKSYALNMLQVCGVAGVPSSMPREKASLWP